MIVKFETSRPCPKAVSTIHKIEEENLSLTSVDAYRPFSSEILTQMAALR
jgi:hypothetical protein